MVLNYSLGISLCDDIKKKSYKINENYLLSENLADSIVLVESLKNCTSEQEIDGFPIKFLVEKTEKWCNAAIIPATSTIWTKSIY